MATPGALVRVLAGALGVPKATVAQHDRNLLVAGLRSKRGRGWAAPSVTPRDIAHLVTAILGSAQVKDSAATVRRYGATRVSLSASSKELFAKISIEELAALGIEHSFVDALDALFTAATLGSWERRLAAKARREGTDKFGVAPSIAVEALAPGTEATIFVGEGEVSAMVTYRRPRDAQAKKQHRVDGYLEEHRCISEKTILKVADSL